jgi:hypothetical protein
MSLFSHLINQGYSKLCSKDCPCSGNPMLYENDSRVTIVTSDDVVCIDTETNKCLYFGYTKNLYNV